MSVKFGFYRFINFRNGRKFLTLLTFGCPHYHQKLFMQFFIRNLSPAKRFSKSC